MLDTLLNALGPLERIAGTIRPPLQARVIQFSYDDFDRLCNHFRGRVFFSPPSDPKRYRVEVELTNRIDQPTYVKRAVLTLNGTKRYESKGKPIKLDPHEVRRDILIFPVERSDAPLEEADFVLEIFPSVGRRTTLYGRMPVKGND